MDEIESCSVEVYSDETVDVGFLSGIFSPDRDDF